MSVRSVTLARRAIRPAVMAAAVAAAALTSVLAATPASGTVDGSAPVQWQFAPVAGTEEHETSVECNYPYCDAFALTVKLPAADAGFYAARDATLTIVSTWDSSAYQMSEDMNVFAFDPAGTRYGPGSPATQTSASGKQTLIILDPPSGVWSIRVTPPTVTDNVSGPITVTSVATLTFTGKPAAPPVLAFSNYTPPLGVGDSAGEPSIGYVPQSDTTYFQASLQTLSVKFDDSVYPAAARWTLLPATPITTTTSLDSILFSDQATGRTFVTQLAGGCGLSAFTDDGQTWTPSETCDAAVDHETDGGGPPPSGIPMLTSYPDAVWYCSQNVVDAQCAISQDGGLTFDPPEPIFSAVSCSGLHGHVRVGPDGYAYVPDRNCTLNPNPAAPAETAGYEKGGAVSADGLTWTVYAIPGTSTRTSPTGTEGVLPGLYGESDPSIAIGPKNTIYEGFANGDGHAEIAVSRDHAQTWSTPVDVGKAFGIQNTEFAEVTAGDDDRAAFAFLGSPTPGDSQSAFFGCTPDKDANGNPVDCPGGRWDLYVSVTYDGGKTWTTTDATPNDPVQRTCIWNGGGTNTCRNLLDFMDITVDRAGRVLVGYPDGCTGACVTSTKWKDNPFSALATIARQNCGRTLYSAYDGKLPACGPVAAARVVPSGSVKSAQRRALPNTSPVTSSALLVLVLAALPLPGALMGLAARRTRR